MADEEHRTEKVVMSRLAFGEKLVAKARERHGKLEEEAQETILFAGTYELAQRMRPHLFTKLKRASEDLERIEKHLARLRSSN